MTTSLCAPALHHDELTVLGKTLGVLEGSGTEHGDTEILMANVAQLASGTLAEDTAFDRVLTHYTRTGIAFHNRISLAVQRDEDDDMIRPGVILKTEKATLLNMRARATPQLLRDAEAFRVSDSSYVSPQTTCDHLYVDDDLLRLTAPPKLRRGASRTAASLSSEPINNSISAVTLNCSKSPQPDDARSASLEGDIMSPNLDEKYLYQDLDLDACIQDPQRA